MLLVAFFWNPGKDLCFQAVTSQVLSAQESLTTVFEMRTGGTSPPFSPGMVECFQNTHNYIEETFKPFQKKVFDQALDLLVSVS